MTKRERAAVLIKDFPDLRQEDIDRCMEMMPHHILFRHDRSECRCSCCGAVMRAETHLAFLSHLTHDVKAHCPECGTESLALCDCYNYSNAVERGAQNFVIFVRGAGDICYAHCIRISVRLDRQIGGYAAEDYPLTETQRYIFTAGRAYRYGRDTFGTYDPERGSIVYRYGPWRYRVKYTEPVWGTFLHDRSYMCIGDETLSGTCLQYAQLDRLSDIALFEYIQFYLTHPTVEHLIKQGFSKLVMSWFKGYSTMIPSWIRWKEHDIRRMLGMDALELREIKRRGVDLCDYHRISEHLPFLSMEERFTYLPIIRSYWGYLSVYEESEQRAVLRYLRRQNERYAQAGTDHFFMTIGDYRDYLHECRDLGYDLTDRMILHPRCLAEAHRRTSEALHAIRREAAQREAVRLAEREHAAADAAARFRTRLAFEDGTLSVRVPASAMEIVDEGKALGHCVGGYAARHAAGRLHILFIRKNSAPDKPWYTMEVSTDGIIVQVRGRRNCDPTPEVAAFVERYCRYIRPLFRLTKTKERTSA